MSEGQASFLLRALNGTRSFVGNSYNRLPVKAPQVVENSITKLDQTLLPYMQKVSLVVDQQVDTTIQKLSPYLLQVKIVSKDKYDALLEKGKCLKQTVSQGAEKLINESVDIALHNKASKLVLCGADSITNRVITSVEDRVHQLADLLSHQNTERQDQQQGYQARVGTLAQEISQLSNQLFVVLKQEVSHRQDGSKVSIYVQKAQSLVQAQIKCQLKTHYEASAAVFKVTIWAPAIEIVSQTKEGTRAYIQYLRQKQTEKQLIATLRKQISDSRDRLSKNQLKNLYQELKEAKILTKLKVLLNEDCELYKSVLRGKIQDSQENNQESQNFNQQQDQQVEEAQEQRSQASDQNGDEQQEAQSKEVEAQSTNEVEPQCANETEPKSEDQNEQTTEEQNQAKESEVSTENKTASDDQESQNTQSQDGNQPDQSDQKSEEKISDDSSSQQADSNGKSQQSQQQPAQKKKKKRS